MKVSNFIFLQNFDPNSAFFTKVVSKKKKNGVNGEQQPQTVKKDKSQEKKSEDEVDTFHVHLQLQYIFHVIYLFLIHLRL